MFCYQILIMIAEGKRGGKSCVEKPTLWAARNPVLERSGS
jgi:hypothetical protein